MRPTRRSHTIADPDYTGVCINVVPEIFKDTQLVQVSQMVCDENVIGGGFTWPIVYDGEPIQPQVYSPHPLYESNGEFLVFVISAVFLLLVIVFLSPILLVIFISQKVGKWTIG